MSWGSFWGSILHPFSNSLVHPLYRAWLRPYKEFYDLNFFLRGGGYITSRHFWDRLGLKSGLSRNYTESCSWDAEADCQEKCCMLDMSVYVCKVYMFGQEKINIPHHSDSHCRFLCNRIISTSVLLSGTVVGENPDHVCWVWNLAALQKLVCRRMISVSLL